MSAEAFVLQGSGLPLKVHAAPPRAAVLAERFAFLQNAQAPTPATQVRIPFPSVDLSPLELRAEEEVAESYQVPRIPKPAKTVVEAMPAQNFKAPVQFIERESVLTKHEASSPQLVTRMERAEQAAPAANVEVETIFVERSFTPPPAAPSDTKLGETATEPWAESRAPEVPALPKLIEREIEIPAAPREQERQREKILRTHERSHTIETMKEMKLIEAPISEAQSSALATPFRSQEAPAAIEARPPIKEIIRSAPMGVVEQPAQFIESAPTQQPVLEALAAASTAKNDTGIRIGSVQVSIRAPSPPAMPVPQQRSAAAASAAIAPTRSAHRSPWHSTRNRQD